MVLEQNHCLRECHMNQLPKQEIGSRLIAHWSLVHRAMRSQGRRLVAAFRTLLPEDLERGFGTGLAAALIQPLRAAAMGRPV